MKSNLKTIDLDIDVDIDRESHSFFPLLEKRVEEVNSLLCVGLDPHLSQIVEEIELEKMKETKEKGRDREEMGRDGKREDDEEELFILSSPSLLSWRRFDLMIQRGSKRQVEEREGEKERGLEVFHLQ